MASLATPKSNLGGRSSLNFLIFNFFFFSIGWGHFGNFFFFKKKKSKWSNCNNLKFGGGGGEGVNCHVLNILGQSANRWIVERSKIYFPLLFFYMSA
jgi:hypothetical protein